jgi:type IV secretory pathway VirB3-like protein
MTVLTDAPPGYASIVHQGPLQPVTILWAPHTFTIYNIMLTQLMVVWVTSRWLVIAAALHLVAALITAIDPHLLAILWRHIRYRRVYEGS